MTGSCVRAADIRRKRPTAGRMDRPNMPVRATPGNRPNDWERHPRGHSGRNPPSDEASRCCSLVRPTRRLNTSSQMTPRGRAGASTPPLHSTLPTPSVWGRARRRARPDWDGAPPTRQRPSDNSVCIEPRLCLAPCSLFSYGAGRISRLVCSSAWTVAWDRGCVWAGWGPCAQARAWAGRGCTDRVTAPSRDRETGLSGRRGAFLPLAPVLTRPDERDEDSDG